MNAIDPRATAATRARYDRNAGRYDLVTRGGERMLTPGRTALWRRVRGPRVLEVGVGTGRGMSRTFAAPGSSGCRLRTAGWTSSSRSRRKPPRQRSRASTTPEPPGAKVTSRPFSGDSAAIQTSFSPTVHDVGGSSSICEPTLAQGRNHGYG